MSANLKKPPGSGATGRMSPSTNPSSPGGPSRGSRVSTPASGVTRTSSVRNSVNGTPISARASVRRPTTTAGAKAVKDEDARTEASLLIDDLKARLQKAEEASEEYQKQVEVLHLRLDDALKEQGRLEERLHEEEERIEGLDNEKRESIRQRQDLERIYEAERAAVIKDKEATQTREEELQEIIQRLKDSLAERDTLRPGTDEHGRVSRTASSQSLEAGHFAPPSTLQRSNSKNNSKILLQKDKLIESLRLELAEAQIKLVEMENRGGGRLQELERTLLETRMANARLMEDNESYQLLLSEKTLNGDIHRNDIFRSRASMEHERTGSRAGAEPGTSLADELSLADEHEHEQPQGEENERVRKYEAEISSLKDQNKALTLYINKIIERILQHQGGFENILSNTDEPPASAGARPVPNKNKELPPAPKDGTPPQGQTFLQRARSVVAGPNKPRPRPQSVMPTSHPSVTENPSTAPSIPLKRAETTARMSLQLNRRSTSDWGQAAATVVGNMYRGGSSDATPASPGQASQRNSFFAFGGAVRTPSGNAVPTATTAAEENEEPQQARKAALDALEGGSGTPSVDTPSPPRSTLSREDKAQGGLSVMTGAKMRPLRLVQEAAEEEAARKAANRSSWLPTGWFSGKENA